MTSDISPDISNNIINSRIFMANIYTDGKYMTMLLSWKKYYQ